MFSRPNSSRQLLRLFALVAAALSVLFVIQVSTHSHANGQDEISCKVCHLAHVSLLRPVTLGLHAPTLVTGYARPFVPSIHQDLFFEDSASRAPPPISL